ncbi:hypothetical protein [Campylobacter devanensis]|uniref:hypothetical protein n=1 Tax=Campylobacter devanensis TaxID=3161138 RepID=UPI000A335384|nr:hypothetical protein [Campylobacter sp. P148]
MREVSISYIDEVNNTKDTLLGLSVLLYGLGRVCEDCDGIEGLKEALYMLNNICFCTANKLQDEASSKAEIGAL